MVWACGPCGTVRETEENELEYLPKDSTWCADKNCGGKTDTQEMKSLMDEDAVAVPDALDQCNMDGGSVQDGTITVVSGLTSLGLAKITEGVELSATAFGAADECREGPEDGTVVTTNISRTVDDATVFSENTAALKTVNSVQRAVAKYMKKFSGTTHRRKKEQLEKKSTEVSDDDTVGTSDDISVNTNVLFEALLDARSRKTKDKTVKEEPTDQTAPEVAVETVEDTSVELALEPALDPEEEPAAQTAPEVAVETVEETSVELALEPALDPAVQPEPESAVEGTAEPAAKVTTEPAEEDEDELIQSNSKSSQDWSTTFAELIGLTEKLVDSKACKSGSSKDASIKSSASNDAISLGIGHLTNLMNYRRMVQEELDLPPKLSVHAGREGSEEKTENIVPEAPLGKVLTVETY
jgi:hypothetical protein